MSRRWRYPRARRGQFYGVPPAGTAPAPPPPYVPAVQEPSGRNSRLVGMRIRRGRFFTVPVLLVRPAPPVRRAPRPAALPRRSKFFAVPPVTAAPTPAWVPPLLGCRRPPVRTTRRGEFFAIPLVGATPPPPPAMVPTFTRGRVRVSSVRRGRFWTPPYPQQPPPPPAPWVPPLIGARHPSVRPPRRGQFLPVPPPRPACPARVVSRRAQMPRWRRAQMFPVPRAVLPPAAPGPYVPRIVSHRVPVRPTRRGVFIEPAWAAQVNPGTPYTPLTDPVSVVRPNLAAAGTRGNAAAAAVRPNTAEAAT